MDGQDDDRRRHGVDAVQPQAFLERERIGGEARLFSDPSNDMACKYGVVHDLDGMEGVEEPRTAVFVLDDDLTVECAWVAEEHPELPPYDEVQRAL